MYFLLTYVFIKLLCLISGSLRTKINSPIKNHCYFPSLFQMVGLWLYEGELYATTCFLILIYSLNAHITTKGSQVLTSVLFKEFENKGPCKMRKMTTF